LIQTNKFLILRNAYENRQKDEFMKRLEDRVKQYDIEIEKLCNSNYQSFVDTFNELLNVRDDTANLKVSQISYKLLQILNFSLYVKFSIK
jgi:hypothetical protein